MQCPYWSSTLFWRVVASFSVDLLSSSTWSGVRVGIDLIKLIKSSIKSLIKSMLINQGIDLFDFFKILCTRDHQCMTLDRFGRFILGKRAERHMPLSVSALPRINSLQLIAWFDLISWCVASHGHSFLREVSAKIFDCLVPKHTHKGRSTSMYQ